MKKTLTFLFVFAFSFNLFSQEENRFGVQFSGYVKNEITFDTRQTAAARQGQFLLWPLPEMPDLNGTDINDESQFNMFAIQSRLKANISAPDAFGAKVSGAIEAAFFGHSNSDVNGFRLRHAFAKLSWSKAELLFGQYWHSLFITDCFPGTVSFNTGVPFQSFSRNPQVRFSLKSEKMKFSVAALSQIDFKDLGPEGGSSNYLRNAALPELQMSLQGGGKTFLAGVGAGYKQIQPRLETQTGYKTEQTLQSFSLLGFAKVVLPALTIKLEGVYGQNMSNMLMLGGYAVSEITDPVRDYREYEPLGVFSVWTDVHTNGKKVQGGVFAGYSKNMGAEQELYASPEGMEIYSLAPEIESVFRVSPRIVVNSGKVRVAAELEYTSAAYGTVQTDATVSDAERVSNLRFLLAGYLFF